MTTKERKSAIAQIQNLYYKMYRAVSSTNDWHQYVELNRQEEREHRRGWARDRKMNLTVEQSTQLFTVRKVLMYAFAIDEAPSVTAFFWLKKSEFAAYAIASNYKERILEAFTEEDAKLAQSWDYAELVK